MPSLTIAAARSTTPHVPPRVSHLEKTYGQFYPSTIAQADDALAGTGRPMRDLNQIYDIVAGLGAVLRIVVGNQVLADQFDPDNPASEPPLSKTTEHMLTTMAAAMCERMRDEIERNADDCNTPVQS